MLTISRPSTKLIPTHPAPLSTLIKNFSTCPLIYPQIAAAEALRAWKEIMSPAVQDRTLRCSVKNNNVFIMLASATLRQELNYKKPFIIEKLRERLQYISINNIFFM